MSACDAGSAANPCSAPEILATNVAPNVENVLSVIVTARVRHADRVVVQYGPPGGSLDSLTASVQVTGETVVVPVLGLLSEFDYGLRVVAYGRCQMAPGPLVVFTTGPLPIDLPEFQAGGTDPSPGYVVFAAGSYGLVIDNTGRVVWYRQFPGSAGLNFQPQPNGRYVGYPPVPSATTGRWVEIDLLGTITRTLGCAGGLVSRFHDLIAEPDGGVWLLCDEPRTMDLTSLGGAAHAVVTGTQVQHISASGTMLFAWSPFDHFALTDGEPADRAGATVNWTHGNALDLDRDGNLLVSFRNLSEITKIDTRTGAVIWRLGGRRNQFAFTDTPLPAFSHQHSARLSTPGAILLLDNLGDPNESRAEQYTLMESDRVARLVQSYGSTPGVVTQIGGSVQPIEGGRTLVSFGTAGRVEEYDATGKVVWRITGGAGYVFRAERIRSLYAPGVGTAR